ncbi:sigma-70 family RNA polymerase sigma factor [Qipengyuania sp. YG27]|uniref:Sigma-70 family RNA polymerase sigma factor n=1 Tax=Qipengyuania mesophila TaxID=2867246 RepID=A0ABS7JWF5_9SPHN|nr:sigma-70 family RNA polymerase sigma factor [Qipengyuania mesophila]MBX7501980.1 sigma-70 family RNA polymerase sigma factor [Qipengyuania mesophila]
MTTTGSTAGPPASARIYDELLVTLVQSGDRRAGERLAARWQPRLARTARRLLAEDEAALAAVQEAWLSILRGIGSLRDPARFAPWAFGILRRRCADRIRRAQAERARSGESAHEPALPASAEEAVAIRQAFAALPPDQRLAAQLFFVEGLTLAEIAEVQEVPLGTAKTRLFHARRKLKAVLTGDDT